MRLAQARILGIAIDSSLSLLTQNIPLFLLSLSQQECKHRGGRDGALVTSESHVERSMDVYQECKIHLMRARVLPVAYRFEVISLRGIRLLKKKIPAYKI